MDRFTIREKSMICVYQYLLCNKNIEDSILDEFETNEIDPLASILVYGSIENKDKYISYINSVMLDYTFDRLGYVERAILLMGCSEFDNKTAYASIIIDQYILLCKKYCDEDAYKLINSVLDRL